MKKPFYADLADLSEDERIEQIAQAVRLGQTVAFITDSDAGKPTGICKSSGRKSRAS